MSTNHPPIASLPMYDWPEIKFATDGWWHALASKLVLSATLQRPPCYSDSWENPGLLFSQTCGYPLTHRFRDKLRYVATPHYAAEGCVASHYCSLIFAREHKPLSVFVGSTAAVNMADSMSGMLALQLVFAPLAQQGRFFAATVETGSHLNSMAAVQQGLADVCAIDAVVVALAKRYRPQALEGLVEIARSPLVPALPYVTVAGNVDELQSALAQAFADPATETTRNALLLADFSILDISDYDVILQLEQQMQAAGGLKLL